MTPSPLAALPALPCRRQQPDIPCLGHPLIDSRMKSRLAVHALENAVAMRGDFADCVVRSNSGSQFRSRRMLRAA